MKIKITWQVDDGYAGGSRPQTSILDTDEYFDSHGEWGKLSDEKKGAIIDGFIQEEFEQRITWDITNKEEQK